MHRIITTTILCVGVHTSLLFAQKDCSNDHLGMIPITDLGTDYFHGLQGGLYPGGSNVRPAAHLDACIAHVSAIEPKDSSGNFDENGKIVMLGIGASNPMTEFQRFINFSEDYEPVNDQLEIVNACVGGVGIQKMYDITENYWVNVVGQLMDLGLSVEQVQVVWIEQENTSAFDTTFPAAPNTLVTDFRYLLEVLRQLFPNLQICYVSARAYAGYADPDVNSGLLYPRDYFNGWAIKFLVEKVINLAPGYITDGAGTNIPMVTWGTYHWSDGSTPNADGLFLDCEIDVGEDGLHLSGLGEYKMGQKLFEFFKTDETAAYWYLDQDYSGIADGNASASLSIYPNPALGDLITLKGEMVNGASINYTIYDVRGVPVLSGSTTHTIDIHQLPAGMFMFELTQGNTRSMQKLIRS